MPKVLEQDGFKFFFFCNEGNPLEPCHIHVRKGGALAKFWISEKAELDFASGFNSNELGKIEKIDNKNIQKIKGAVKKYASVHIFSLKLRNRNFDLRHPWRMANATF